jgi:hypothetical protein
MSPPCDQALAYYKRVTRQETVTGLAFMSVAFLSLSSVLHAYCSHVAWGPSLTFLGILAQTRGRPCPELFPSAQLFAQLSTIVLSARTNSSLGPLCLTLTSLPPHQTTSN